MNLLPIHRRFIGRSVLFTVLATWLVLTGFAVLGALLDEVEDFGLGDYSFGHALLYLALQTPRRAYESFPMAAVIGSVLALGGHAAKSELVALRAGGLSPWRIGATALLAVAVVVAPLMIAMETAIPYAEQRAQALKLSAMQREVTLAGGANVWAREGGEVFNAQGGERRFIEGRPVMVFSQVRVFAFDAQGRLAWIQEAGEADYDESRGWELRDVKRTTFGARSVSIERFATQAWATALKPGAIEASLQHPDLLTTAALGGRIEQLKRNGLDAGAMSEAYWARWFFPLTTLALVFAALPVAFGQQRSGGFGQRLFIGIVFALVARLVQPMLVNLAKAYQWPIVIAYALPVLALVALGVWWIRRR